MTDKSFALFLCQARGSLYELQTQIELASQLGFVGAGRAESVLADSERVARMIHALLATLRKANA